MTSPWHPIESAPKDGSYVLAYGKGLFPPITMVCWHDYPPTKEGSNEHFWLDRGLHMIHHITHWMPLPEGPSP